MRGVGMSQTLLQATIVPIAGELCLLSTAAKADCAYPQAPIAIPNGGTASEAEMTAAAAVCKQCNSDVTACLACLQDETAANAAIEELASNVAKSNAQVRAFKSKKACHGGPDA